MWTQHTFLAAFLVFSAFISAFARAADCNLNQPRRNGDLSGNQIVDALNSQSNLENVCGGNWRTADTAQLENSYSWWGMIWTIQRTDNAQPLRYCKDAMQNIMDQCITNGNFWGGSWSLNGEIYTISNSIYPVNPEFPVSHPSTHSGALTPTITASKGPITMGPQTSIEKGEFSTTTRDIEGFTANSVTTTTADNHPTVLPIWFVGPGIGIIVIPLPGVIPGGLVPSPPGYPPLSIGSDGRPSSTDVNEDEGRTDITSTITSTPVSTSSTITILSSTSSCDCSSCTLASVVDVPEDPTGIADIETDYPFIIPGGETPFGTTSGPLAPATQPAVPIDEPACIHNDDTKPAPHEVQVSGGNIELKDLLFRIRQNLCGGPCAAPEGIRPEVVNVTSSPNGQLCSISVRISKETEAYAFRNSAPSGDQWQQCWDSTENIINKCINNNVFTGRKGNEGWWNGNHVYQFYQVGFRAWIGAPIPWWLPPAGIKHTDSEYCLHHYPLCSGYQGRPAQSLGRRSKLGSSKRKAGNRILPREIEADVCGIRYNLPNHPSTSKSTSPRPSSAQRIKGIHKWVDRRDITQPGGLCTWELYISNDRVVDHQYATEHIWEKHFIKTFLNWLSHDNEDQHCPVIDCAGKRAVFDTLSTTPNSPFSQITPAQALANSISCYGRNCPVNNRASEFMILEAQLNLMKTHVTLPMISSGAFEAQFK